MEKRFTQKDVKDFAKLHGFTVRIQDGEFRINKKGATEEQAYYTNWADDAIDTMQIISEGGVIIA